MINSRQTVWDTVRNFVNSSAVNTFIIIVILINSITLGMETSEWLRSHIGNWLYIIDRAALYIFTLEIIAKFICNPKTYLKEGWSWFDIILVALSFLPATGAMSALRCLRILRVLLFISFLPKLRVIVQSLILSLPSIGWISLLLLLVFYVFSVIATTLFGSAFGAWFGTLGKSFFTLFQIMTLESWAMGIVRPICDVYPYAWLFFVPFVLISSFVILNVFIAVIVNGMGEARRMQEKKQARLEAEMLSERETIAREIAKIRESLENIEKRLDTLGR